MNSGSQDISLNSTGRVFPKPSSRSTRSPSFAARTIARKESRGSHYRDDFPKRIDDPFHATTRVSYAPGQTGNCAIDWEAVPLPLVPLRERNYGAATPAAAEKKEEAAASN